MAGGICKKHGTELNGFGTYTFCNQCDSENKGKPEVETLYGYLVKIEELKVDTINLTKEDLILLNPPDLGLIKAFIYKFKLEDIGCSYTAYYNFAYPDNEYKGVKVEKLN